MQDWSTDKVELIIPILAIGGSFVVAIVYFLVDGVRRTLQTRAREMSRREIAAYVAEGSISPDDAVRLIGSGKSGKEVRDRGKS